MLSSGILLSKSVRREVALFVLECRTCHGPICIICEKE